MYEITAPVNTTAYKLKKEQGDALLQKIADGVTTPQSLFEVILDKTASLTLQTADDIFTLITKDNYLEFTDIHTTYNFPKHITNVDIRAYLVYALLE